MAKKHRLFKVARELNTGSSTLSEYLTEKGFEVEDDPNAKLSDEMYSLLLKEFASEKALKQKAEQIKERKREERLGNTEDPQKEEEEEILSAADLRSGILEAKPKAKPTLRKFPTAPPPESKNPPQKEASEVKEPAVAQEKPQEAAPAQVETPVAKVESSTESPAKESSHGLKVVDKIDLSQFDRKPSKKAEKPVKKTAAEQPKREDKAPAKVEAEKKAEPADAPPVTAKTETPKKETKAPETKAPVAKQETSEEEEKDDVLLAADHTPKLAGLKVLGKVELPGERPKLKKKDASSDDDADKKKRRRKRKRKKTGTTGGPTVTPPKKAGERTRTRSTTAKKEEPSDKEIKEQIKKTLAEIESRASRSRQRLRREKRQEGARRREREAAQREEDALVLEVTEFITANEFANLMEIPVTTLITKCMEIGMFVSINQRLDKEVIELLAEEYGYEANFVDIAETEFDEEEEEDDPEDLEPRWPIVTVMGHVDHGKTSLLDYVRHANVIAGEAGGITQHIGAYNVALEDGNRICFIDTPGHEAFTAMRARGAKVTDIVIIVIAADDAVMPQTKEAIQHAQAAGVPMIFALNKIDKPGADPDRIRTQLSEMNILLEDWGGKYQAQEISAKKGTGIPELLEKVLLEAELLELKANPDKLARGTVIESKLDKGRGIMATLLVQEGNLKVGDSMVAGIHYGRVRALMDERGKRIKSAGPSTPVQLLGLSGAPQAGDRFVIYESEKNAKDVASRRNELFREQAMRQTKRLSLEELARRSKIGEIKDLNIIVKGDVDGSIEALSDSLLKLSMEEVQVNVIRKAVGQISEADVLLATASNAIIIGFQVRPSVSSRKLAEEEGIDIRLYSIIYDAINDVRDALEGMLSPDLKEEITGSAEIREVFRISKVGNVAGCMVIDGVMNRKDPIRLIRDGIVVYNGKLSSLKRFKEDAREVKTGFECGMQIDGYNDIKERDVIEQYHTSEVKRTLDS